MELYTLVSLLIGLFGGTFAALNGLRNLLDADFQKISSSASDQAAALIEVTGDGHAANLDCHRFKADVQTCSRVWRYISIVQVGFFTVLIYAVAIFAIRYWDEIAKHHSDAELAVLLPIKLSPTILAWGMAVNLLCILMAAGAFIYCRVLLRRINKIGEYTKPPKGVAAAK